MIQRHSFRAMGTDVECLLDGDPGDRFAAVEDEFERLEALLSRFRPESELSRLNTNGELAAGPDLLAVTKLALAARDQTSGRLRPDPARRCRRCRLRPDVRAREGRWSGSGRASWRRRGHN